jgi:hypothetical protein
MPALALEPDTNCCRKSKGQLLCQSSQGMLTLVRAASFDPAATFGAPSLEDKESRLGQKPSFPLFPSGKSERASLESRHSQWAAYAH